jgi:hypothetical protein
MCTSTARNPARVKAAPISTSPFTPCSRRMATVGRLREVASDRVEVASGSDATWYLSLGPWYFPAGGTTSGRIWYVTTGRIPGLSRSSFNVYSDSAHAGLSRSAAIRRVTSDQIPRSAKRSSTNTSRPDCRTRKVWVALSEPIRLVAVYRVSHDRSVAMTASRSDDAHLDDGSKFLAEQRGRRGPAPRGVRGRRQCGRQTPSRRSLRAVRRPSDHDTRAASVRGRVAGSRPRNSSGPPASPRRPSPCRAGKLPAPESNRPAGSGLGPSRSAGAWSIQSPHRRPRRTQRMLRV